MTTSTWLGPDSLMFETAASDDVLWVSPASIDQVTSLITDPNRWIQELNDLSSSDPWITIRKDFVLRLKLRDSQIPLPVNGKDCIVQGIVGTNLLTVRPCVSLGEQTDADWVGYWDDWEKTGALKVTYSADSNQAYAHLELTAPNDTAAIRADKIAAFLMWGSDPTKSYVPEGSGRQPYINKILGKTPNSVTVISGGVSRTMTPSGAYFKPVTAVQLLNVTFSLAANADDFNSSNPLGYAGDTTPPPPVACDNMAGSWSGTEILLDDVVVKNYAQPPVPAPPSTIVPVAAVGTAPRSLTIAWS